MHESESGHTLNYKILDPRIGDTIPLPHYATAGSAGMDLRACTEASLTVKPGETHLIPTGPCYSYSKPRSCSYDFATFWLGP